MRRNTDPRYPVIEPAPLPSETTIEHVRNAQQLALEVEHHLHHMTTRFNDAHVTDALLALHALKRRLGWVAAKVL